MRVTHPQVLSGYRFDWVAAFDDAQRLRKAGRPLEAAEASDPGVVRCPECGELLWRDGLHIACSRCDAVLRLPYEHRQKLQVLKRGDPRRIPPKLKVGMRVRLLHARNWASVHVPRGRIGTVAKLRSEPGSILGPIWHVVFDEKVFPEAGAVFGIGGPFLDPVWFMEVRNS